MNLSEEHCSLGIKGYECFHMYGNKTQNVKKGRYSGGLSIYYKQTLAKSVEIVETHQNGILCVKLNKKLFSFREDVYIINVYVPPTNSNVIDLNNFDLFDELEIYSEKYKCLGKSLITAILIVDVQI